MSMNSWRQMRQAVEAKDLGDDADTTRPALTVPPPPRGLAKSILNAMADRIVTTGVKTPDLLDALDWHTGWTTEQLDVALGRLDRWVIWHTGFEYASAWWDGTDVGGTVAGLRAAANGKVNP